jgi:hypothetical protein
VENGKRATNREAVVFPGGSSFLGQNSKKGQGGVGAGRKFSGSGHGAGFSSAGHRPFKTGKSPRLKIKTRSDPYMFKGIHPIFWVGLALMYGFAIIFWIWEIASDVGTIHTKIFGIPAPWVYGNFFVLFVLSLFISWLYYYFPEKNPVKRKEE